MVPIAVYFLIIYVFISPILIQYGVLPNVAKWGVDILAGAFLPISLIRWAITKKYYAKRSYLVIISFAFFIAAISFLLNQGSAPALILGLKQHFKYLPFFLLPLFYDFTESEIKKILFLLCFILLLQAPITLVQRFIWYAQLYDGDVVGGTINESGWLSVILVSAIAILYTLLLAKQIELKKFIILSILLFIPTIINETKVTFFLLPLSLAISTVLSRDEKVISKFMKIIIFFFITSIFTIGFIYTYDLIYGRLDKSFLEYIALEKEGKGYIYLGDKKVKEQIQEKARIGRFDSIFIAIKKISNDPGQLFLGIGMGNALSPKINFLRLEDNDIQKYWPDITTISNILWEFGLMGIFIHLIFFILMFKDAISMRGQDTFLGAFCLAWCSVISIMFLTYFYLNVFYANPINVTFWLLSGIVISKSGKLEGVRDSAINKQTTTAQSTEYQRTNFRGP